MFGNAIPGLYCFGLIAAYFGYRAQVGGRDGSVFDLCVQALPSELPSEVLFPFKMAVGLPVGSLRPPCGIGVASGLLHLGATFSLGAHFAAKVKPEFTECRMECLAICLAGLTLTLLFTYPTPASLAMLVSFAIVFNTNGKGVMLLVAASGVTAASTVYLQFRDIQKLRWVEEQSVEHPAAHRALSHSKLLPVLGDHDSSSFEVVLCVLLLLTAVCIYRGRSTAAGTVSTDIIHKLPYGIRSLWPLKWIVEGTRVKIVLLIGALWSAENPDVSLTVLFLVSVYTLSSQRASAKKWKMLLSMSHVLLVCNYVVAIGGADLAMYKALHVEVFLGRLSATGFVVLYSVSCVVAYVVYSECSHTVSDIESGACVQENEWNCSFAVFVLTVAALLGVALHSGGVLPALGVALFTGSLWCCVAGGQRVGVLGVAMNVCVAVCLAFQAQKVVRIDVLDTMVGTGGLALQTAWVVLAAVFSAQLRAPPLPPPTPPRHARYFASGFLTPAALLAVSTVGPTAGTVSGLLYYILGSLTALPSWISLEEHFEGRQAGQWRWASLIVAVPVGLLLHVLILPKQSVLLYLPLTETWNVLAADSTQATSDTVGAGVLWLGLPHFVVIIAGLVERWSWVGPAPLMEEDVGLPSQTVLLVSSVLYEATMVLLAVNIIVTGASLLAILKLLALIFTCLAGKGRFVSDMKYGIALFCACIAAEFVGYGVGMQPGRLQLALQYCTAFATAVLIAVNMSVRERFMDESVMLDTFSARRMAKQMYGEGFSSLLIRHQAGINDIWAKRKELAELRQIFFDDTANVSHNVSPSATISPSARGMTPRSDAPSWVQQGYETASLLGISTEKNTRNFWYSSFGLAVMGVVPYILALTIFVDGVSQVETPISFTSNETHTNLLLRHRIGQSIANTTTVTHDSNAMVSFTRPFTVSQIVRLLAAVLLLAQLPRVVWYGNGVWKATYYGYALLLLYWWLSAAGFLPEGMEDRNERNRVFSLFLAGALWKWGRVMDSPYWGYVLTNIYSKRIQSLREGQRICDTQNRTAEAVHSTVAVQREARRAALSELQSKKADLHKAWRKLLKGELTHSRTAATPPLSASFFMNSYNDMYLSPGLFPEDADPSSCQSDAGSLPSDSPTGPSFIVSEFFAKISELSYKRFTVQEVQRRVQCLGYWGVAWSIGVNVATSLVAELIYVVMCLYFLANPCVATLAPLSTVFLYAMCASPFPDKMYWKHLLTYYQGVIVVKGALLSYLAERGFGVSNSVMMLLFGWRNVLQVGDFSFIQFALWDISLFALILLHRHCLLFVWGIWEGEGMRTGRFLPMKNCAHGACLQKRTLKGFMPCDQTEELGARRMSSVSTASCLSPTQEMPSLVQRAQFGMWGGVKADVATPVSPREGAVGRTFILGGAAVQLVSQATDDTIPSWLGQKARKLWRSLGNVSAKAGADLYAPAFVVEMIGWIVTVAGFPAIVGSNDSIAESIKSNLLPGVLVLILFGEFVFMITDRVIYLLRSLHVKAVFHCVLTVLYLGFYLIWGYLHMERYGTVIGQTFADRWRAAEVMRPNFVLQLYCGLKLLYLALSAVQIRMGYPDLISSHFFSGRYTPAWYYLYTMYRGIPFLFEFRSVLDWTFTKTSLKLAYWMRLEDLTHELHSCLCDREDTKKLYQETGGPGRAFPVVRKCASGAALLMGLSVLLFFPLLWYSSYGPALTEDYISDASIEVTVNAGDESFGTFYEGSRQFPDIDLALKGMMKEHKSLMLSNQWNKVLEKTRQSLAGFGLAYGGTRTSQVLSFQESSQSLWSLSVPAAASLLRRVSNSTVPITLIMSVTLHRPYAPPAFVSVSGRQSHILTQSEREDFLGLLNKTHTKMRVAQMYTPVVLNRASEITFYEESPLVGHGFTNKVACDLGLLRDTQYTSYWDIRCGTLFAYGNPPTVVDQSGVGDFRFSEDERACFDAEAGEEATLCAKVAYDRVDTPPHFVSVAGTYLLAISDRVTNGNASMIPSIGVVAIYTTFVLAVGRVLRSSMTGDGAKLHLLEVEAPGEMNTLVGYIQMARMEGDLELEHGYGWKKCFFLGKMEGVETERILSIKLFITLLFLMNCFPHPVIMYVS